MAEEYIDRVISSSQDTTISTDNFVFDTIGGNRYGVSKVLFGAVGTATYVSAADPLPVTISGVATAALQTTANGILATMDADTGAIATSAASIDGKITACNTGAVVVSSSALPSGASTAAKQPALGTAGTASADVITVQGIASMTALKVDGSAVTQPVSGSVTANIGTVGTLATAANQTTGNTSLATIAGAVAGTEVQVDIVTMPNVTIAGTVTVGSHAVTNAGTFAVQVDGAALTSLQLLDDSVATVAAAITSKGMAAIGTDGTNARILKTDTDGQLQVDVLSCALPTGAATSAKQDTINAVVVTAEAVVSPDKVMAIGSYNNNNGVYKTLQSDDNGYLVITTANPLGTTASGATAHDVALSDNPVAMGGYASATAPTDVSANGDAVYAWHLRNGAQVVNLAVGGTLVTGSAGLPVAQQGTWNVATVTTLTGGGIAHDSADSGNPVKVGARAAATLSDDTMVANADRTDAVADLDGALLVRPGFPLGDLISEQVTNTNGTSTAFTNFGATASTRNYVTAITVYNSSATAGTIDFRDGTAGTVLWTMPIPATGGSVISNGGMPLFCTTANTALAFDVSGALTTVTISISGFKSKARA